MTLFSTSFFALLFGSGVFPSSGAAFSCPDLALVLAIDSSGSIDDRDFDLQKWGYAAALTDTKVLEALASAGLVDVAVVFWGDAEMSSQVLPWRRIAGPADAAGLAADIARTPRLVTGDTGIGRGLWTALDLLEDSEACAARQIINVSGDGKESHGARPRHHVPLVEARLRATEMGVTVNGLAITVADNHLSDWGLSVESGENDLADWYRTRVITGPDAFVMTATSFEVFGAAIRRKLLREITLPVVAAVETRQEVEL